MATIATFVNATAGPYAKQAMNPKRQRLLRLLAKAAWAQVNTSGTKDYSTSVTRTKALITDAAPLTIGMTPDQVEAARIIVAYGNAGTGALGTLTTNLNLIRPWMELDEASLDRMELVVEYFMLGLS